MSTCSVRKAENESEFWRKEAERMEMQLRNEKIQWEEKEQELISEIHLRDSELTALEHEIRESAKTIKELKRVNREAEDVAMSHATYVHSLQSKPEDALHIEGVRDMKEDLIERFPFIRDLIKKEIDKLSQSDGLHIEGVRHLKEDLTKRFPFVRGLIQREINKQLIISLRLSQSGVCT